MKALIAMSGGVDSSVAAKIMSDKGYECVGCTMHLYSHKDEYKTSDKKDAKEVSDKLGIPFYIYNYEEEFKNNVIEQFVRSYEEGKTPNPCIECNKCMKFDKLFEKMKELGCDKLVTGHYARVEKREDGKGYYLKKALDETKDQSYVLFRLSKDILPYIEFPLGSYEKTKIRELAKDSGFSNADKGDSQDICFIPDGDYAGFIKEYRNTSFKEGNFVDKEGNVLGKHKGIINYTIGQRKGLGIALGKPMYVVEINTEKNEVVLGDNKDLFTNVVYATDINLLTVDKIEEPMRIKAKIRYKHKESQALVYQLDDNNIKVIFDTPQRAITPGQSLVLYDGDIVVGGGRIVLQKN